MMTKTQRVGFVNLAYTRRAALSDIRFRAVTALVAGFRFLMFFDDTGLACE